jgi:hypothetical protein
MTTQFQVGQTYNVDREYGEFITITRRTDKSVWLKHEDGTESRKGIKFADDTECFALNTFTMIFAKPAVNEPQVNIDYKPINPKYDHPEYHETQTAETPFKVGNLHKVCRASYAKIIDRTQNLLTFEWDGKTYQRHIFNNMYTEVVNIEGYYTLSSENPNPDECDPMVWEKIRNNKP